MRKKKRKHKRRSVKRFKRPFPHWFLWGFFILMGIIGFSNSDEYGITWDEVIQRQHGMVSMDYINDLSGELYYDGDLTNFHLEQYEHAHYGVLFPLSMTHIDVLFKLRNFRTVFIVRRLGVFAVFLLGLFFLYKTVSYHLNNRWMGFLAILMAALSPRIFAHGHFNSKDIILMSGYMMAAYTMIRFLDKPDYRWAVIHGLTCAIAINTRILGMAIPAMTVAWFVLDQFFLKDRRRNLIQILAVPAVFLGTTAVLTVFFWPYLWFDPFGHFVESFQKLAHFHWNSDMIFMGEPIKPADLPWYYIPVWMGITSPIMFSVLFLTGCYFTLRPLLKNLKNISLYTNRRERNGLVLVGLVLAPVLLVIIQNSSIYNGWRHMYFIYLPFLALAVTGYYILWHRLVRKGAVAYILPALLAINMATTLVFMWRHHPLQAVYFNVLAGEEIEQKYDVEYWGSSLQALYEKVLDRSGKGKIRIACANWNSPVQWNREFLPEDQRERIQIVEQLEPADYYFSLYLWEEWTKRQRNIYPMNRPAIQLKVGDMPVSGAHILH